MPSWSTPPFARSESVAELAAKLQDAIRRGDRTAVDRRMLRLDRAIAEYDGLCIRLGVRREGLPEARQAILVRLYDALHRRAETTIDNFGAFAQQAAEWAVRDLLRKRRSREIPIGDEPWPQGTHDDSGVYSVQEVAAQARLELLLEESRRRLSTYVGQYVRAAAALGRVRRGPQQLIAWFLLRVQRRPAEEVARMLGIGSGANGGVDAVAQWAHRGAELIERLAEGDADKERASVMRTAAKVSAIVHGDASRCDRAATARRA